MTSIAPLPGFDWSRLKWGAPDAPQSDNCSYCAAEIPDGSVPLILWRADGSAIQFCAACQKRWWGMESYEQGEPDE